MTPPSAKAKMLFYWTKWRTQCVLLEANIKRAKTKLASPLHVQGFLEHLVLVQRSVPAGSLYWSEPPLRGVDGGRGREPERRGGRMLKVFLTRCWTRRVFIDAKLRAALDCAPAESIRAQFGFPNSAYECSCSHYILPFIFLNLSNVGSRWQQA